MNYYQIMDEAREKFIKETEEKYNGKITYISFAKLLGFSIAGSHKNLNGLIYIINDIVYFEDFKPRPSPLMIYTDKEFTKYEFSIPLKDIKSFLYIKESEALSCVRGAIKYTDITPLVGKLKTHIFKGVSMLLTTKQSGIFFDITDYKNFPIK